MTPTRVVDSHVHFWDPSVLAYPWLDDVPLLRRAFLPLEFAPLSTGATDAVVFVEANCEPASNEREVAWVEVLAEREPRIAGIVAYADMLNDDNRAGVLQRLRNRPRVVGVRHNIQGHPAGYCLQAAFVRGVQEVGALGLTFDLCATADQLRDVMALVRQCPSTVFVLDHCGKPDMRHHLFDAWSRDLSKLAALPNVHCKLSGLLTEAEPGQRDHDTLWSYAACALANFGDDRLLYGSDWPVVTLASGEPTWRAFCDHFTRYWSVDARQRFYADNALRCYGISHLHTNHV